MVIVDVESYNKPHGGWWEWSLVQCVDQAPFPPVESYNDPHNDWWQWNLVLGEAWLLGTHRIEIGHSLENLKHTTAKNYESAK